MQRLIYLFVFIGLMQHFAFSQVYTATVTEGSKEYQIAAYKKNNLIYFSFSDIAAKLGIKNAVHPANGKAELYTEKYAVKFGYNNAFAVITDRATKKQEVLQLPVSTQFRTGILYIPSPYLINLLKNYIDRSISLPVKPQGKLDEKTVVTEETDSDDALRVKVEEKINGTLLRLNSSSDVKEFTASYQSGMLTIKIAPAFEAWQKTPELEPNSVIESMMVKQSKSETQIKIKVNGQYAAHELIKSSEKGLLLTIHKKQFGEFSRKPDPKKNKWKFDVVVIDAGHGGKDFGAIGVNNTVEKDINLAVALKLGAAIQREMPDVKVVYTRKTDTFVELYKRGKIANEQNGKLFISIHCNSVPHKLSGPHGYEIYLLRPGRTQEAIAIAERENGVISYEDDPKRYQKLTDENFILVTMAHAANMKYSEKFSELLDRQLREDVSIVSKGVKQAGFYVLVGASMPSILFETGYVTNEQDAAYMRSAQGQNQIAESLCKAVKSFKLYYAHQLNNE